MVEDGRWANPSLSTKEDGYVKGCEGYMFRQVREILQENGGCLKSPTPPSPNFLHELKSTVRRHFGEMRGPQPKLKALALKSPSHVHFTFFRPACMLRCILPLCFFGTARPTVCFLFFRQPDV